MELIKEALEKSKDTLENRPHELLSLLEYYYRKDHFRAWVVATLLLDEDLPSALQEEIRLKLSLSAYYCGFYSVGRKHARALMELYPDSPIYKHNNQLFDDGLGQSYDYCIHIWEEGYRWFIDVARALKWQLEQQGKTVIISEQLLANTKVIVLGANNCISVSKEIPSDAIIYNLEHLYNESPWNHPNYRRLLSSREIWDFSEKNILWLKENSLGKQVKLRKISYAPSLEFNHSVFLSSNYGKIDVLFIGGISERRQAIMYQIKELNSELNVVFSSNSWGVKRDELISRASIILNIHYYETGILETPRVSYMVANKKFVISESSLPEDEQDWPGVVFVPYAKIAETVVEYVKQSEKRTQLAQEAYDKFLGKELV